ncbi:MAG: VWA domain-containing protein [Desulfobulbaceae bacterium]|nr:VWA domain-containing protein [Desulfobulbaceae bacterium]
MESGLQERLQEIIPPQELNVWERDELLEQLAEYEPALEKLVLAQIEIIWPVSHSLCFAFLEYLADGLSCLSPEQIPEWVKGVLDAYEADGLRAARTYMDDVENNFLCRLRGESGLVFDEAQGRLVHYLRGLSQRNLQLESSQALFTDTSTIFLPREMTLFQENRSNFFAYKLLLTFQWAFLERDIYCQNGTDPYELEHFFLLFDRPELAQEVYHLLQTVRICRFLQEQLPGLMRDGHALFQLLRRKNAGGEKDKRAATALFEARQWLLAKCSLDEYDLENSELEGILISLLDENISNKQVFEATTHFYNAFCGDAVSMETGRPLLFQGELRTVEARQRRLNRREENKQKFITALAAVLPPQASSVEDKIREDEEKGPAANIIESGANVSPMKSSADKEPGDKQHNPEDPRYICLDDEHIELPEELRELADEIRNDLGELPSFYIASASQMAGGQGESPQASPESREGQSLQGGITYDEWDYRRQGFRKNWCRLIEKKVTPTKGTFVSTTMDKYRGQIIQLKRQFEMMRTHHRFVRRQRDGDDIDLDALTEAYADVKAGFTPSERLFIRLLRDERDIAALFMVDMSSSTEGWVGTALKESLVLLSESLHSLGDRYAIYGFSGMRRTRSEIYHVKGFEEPYTEEIKDRIAAISPIDYTRMGPPIRHFTKVLRDVEARVRLLIILTDGKPEDYDDYKGQYAIEDTRHALIEAKNAGIHPFCISIDREAQDYMGHMFGEVNYAFINDVKKLPLRVPEIYQSLTT